MKYIMTDMETIFDHDPTAEEMDVLFGGPFSPDHKKMYLEVIEGDSALADLYRLFNLRGDPKAEHYLAAIKDRRYAFELTYNDLVV